MTSKQAITTLGLLVAEIDRHQRQIADILEMALDQARSETALEQNQRAQREDAGSAHGHPGAPREPHCTRCHHGWAEHFGAQACTHALCKCTAFTGTPAHQA